MQFWGEVDSEAKRDKYFREVVKGCDNPPFHIDNIVETNVDLLWYPDIEDEEKSLETYARRIRQCCGGTKTEITCDTNNRPILHIMKGNIQEFLTYTDHGLTSFNGFLPKYLETEDGCLEIVLVNHIRKWSQIKTTNQFAGEFGSIKPRELDL